MSINIGEMREMYGDKYKSFVPNKFPPELKFSNNLIKKAAEAERALGKLDGLLRQIPNKDLFLFMYLKKDALESSKIEGTRAEFTEIIEYEAIGKEKADKVFNKNSDVNDVIDYIVAINLGIKKLSEIPISIRLIKIIHKELMKDGRKSQTLIPGEFRKEQNWLESREIENAKFVPPHYKELDRAMDDLEKFINNKNDNVLELIKVSLMHAQFETIHPFIDGNGRTGRMLVSLYMHENKLLEIPVLYLSWYLNKERKKYFELLNGYRFGEVEEFVNFFVSSIKKVCEESIKTTENIFNITKEDGEFVKTLTPDMSKKALKVLEELYKNPIIDSVRIQKIIEATSRSSTFNLIKKFEEKGILEKYKKKSKPQLYIHRKYFNAFDC